MKYIVKNYPMFRWPTRQSQDLRRKHTMKKFFMFLLAAITTLSACFAGFAFEQQQDDKMWRDFGNTKSGFQLYINTDSKHMEAGAVFNALTKVAQEYHANLIKTDEMGDSHSSLVVKSVFLTYQGALAHVPLLSGTSLKPDDMTGNRILQTPNLAAPKGCETAGVLRSFLNRGKVRFQPLTKFVSDQKTADGTYSVELEKPEDKREMVQALASELNLSKEDLTKQKGSTVQNDSFFIVASVLLAVICLFLFALFTSHYIIQHFKFYGTCKLLGYSNSTVWKSIFLPILFTQLFITCLVAAVFCRRIYQQELMLIAGFGLATAAVTFLISLIFYHTLQSYTISNLIKNKKPTKVFLVVNHSVRFVLLTAVCVFSFTCAAGISSLTQTYLTLQNWDQYGDKFAVFNSKLTSRDQSELQQNIMTLEKKYIKFYSLANQKGAVYTQADRIDPFETLPDFDKTKIPAGFNPYLLTVNPNYLKEFPLRDCSGKLVSVSENETKGIYILPDTYQSKAEEIKNIFSAIRKRDIKGSNGVSGVQEKLNTDITLFYYPAGLRVFSFDTNVESQSKYEISDCVFSVMTEKNASSFEKSDLNGHEVNSHLKIPIQNADAGKTFQEYKPLLASCGLQNNMTALNSIKSVFENQINQSRNGLRIYLVISLLLIALTCWISFETIRILIESKSKKLSTMKALGYKFMGKYGADLMPFLFLWAVQFGVAAVVYTSQLAGTGIKISGSVYLGALPLFLVDIGILLLSVLHFDRKNAVNSMKEG